MKKDESISENSRQSRDSDRCPQCGFTYAWDGTNCRHCNPCPQKSTEAPKKKTQNRQEFRCPYCGHKLIVTLRDDAMIVSTERSVTSSRRENLPREQRRKELSRKETCKNIACTNCKGPISVYFQRVIPAVSRRSGMGDYSLVRNQNDEVCGLWLRNPEKAKDLYLICGILGLKDVPLPKSFRTVPNRYDDTGGCFCMFGSARAPGE